MKTVVAFVNGSGGKIVFGIEDNTRKVIGIKQEDAFRIMDGLTRLMLRLMMPLQIHKASD